MKFSTEPVLWSESLCEPSEQKCNEAIDWISAFEAYGGTCTIDALRVCLDPFEFLSTFANALVFNSASETRFVFKYEITRSSFPE